jgi:putative ABC transport system substrate-binding protein
MQVIRSVSVWAFPIARIRAASSVVDELEVGLVLIRIGWLALSVSIAALIAVDVATAQQLAKVARVGILDGGSPYPEREALWNGFKEALREAGHVEGKNVAFDFRWTSGQPRLSQEMVNDLVRANVDVIVTAGTPVALVAKRATTKIPIVLVLAGDPIQTGLATNLNRPGGNVTGLTTLSTELSAKRLELMKELVPEMTQLGIIWDDNPAFTLAVRNAEAAARVMKISTQAIQVHGRDELEMVIADFSRRKVGALEVMPGQTFLVERQRIAELALRHRLPTVFAQREYVEAGGLISYGSNLRSLFLRAATYVDKILKGTSPGDLPIEQPTTFELAINIGTAKALGLTVPPSLRARADLIIE